MSKVLPTKSCLTCDPQLVPVFEMGAKTAMSFVANSKVYIANFFSNKMFLLGGMPEDYRVSRQKAPRFSHGDEWRVFSIVQLFPSEAGK